VLLAVVGIGALVWSGGLSGLGRSKAVHAANPEVHRGNYDKLHAGMTLAEVEEIFGPGERVASKDLPQDDEYSIRGIRAYANDYRATKFYRWRNGPNEIYVGLGLSRNRREVVVLHAFYFEIAARGPGSRGRELDGAPADSVE
jgi:hypothetical protein